MALRVYRLGIRVAALWNSKARHWIEGRKELFPRLTRTMKNAGAPVIWFHCASLGEFEQGRPLIEKARCEEPNAFILLTFFSPSGYLLKKDHEGVDAVFYLPLDTAYNAKRFVETVAPEKVFFVKYEYWYHYLRELHEREIPTFLIAAQFRADHLFFKWYGRSVSRVLHYYDHIFVQTKSSGELLEKVGVYDWTLSGDTRVDRVAELPGQKPALPEIRDFTREHTTIVAGSTWPPDEALILACISRIPGVKWILVPHEVDTGHIQNLQEKVGEKGLLYSRASAGTMDGYEVLIVDSVGFLSQLYRFADIAYVGGGFGSGLHNTLEPAAFGLPVLFGPDYGDFPEAVEMVRKGGAFSVKEPTELSNQIQALVRDGKKRKDAGARTLAYVNENKGATNRIWQRVKAGSLKKADRE